MISLENKPDPPQEFDKFVYCPNDLGVLAAIFFLWPTEKIEQRRQIGVTRCNGPGVVQRKDRQKKEFHDQSDYR